jgi:uncharacterized membrane protein
MNMNKNPGLWVVILTAVILWNIYDMASATEAQSQAVVVLHWVLLICAVAGIIGAVMQYRQQRKRQGG